MRLFLLWKRHSTSYQLRLKQTYAFLVQRVCHTMGSQRHEQTRNNRRKMQWGICQKTLSNRGYFQRHINNHHALKPQACLKCNARPVTSPDSAPHNELWLHGFQSDICQQRFARKDGLQDHIHGKHDCNACAVYMLSVEIVMKLLHDCLKN